MTKNWLRFGSGFLPALAADLLTKQWALAQLEPGRTIRPLGALLPLTLSFNRGAAFSLSLGGHSRLLFTLFSIAACVWLLVYQRQTPPGARLRSIALPLIVAGACGNLVDRLRWDRGVIDFLGPYDLGFMDWPIFNVADIWITCGAAALALGLWLEERRGQAERAR